MEAALFSILVREKEGRHGTIVFGDDPEPHAGFCAVSGEESKPCEQAVLVFNSIVLVEFAPIACVVTMERGLHFISRNGGECARCGDNVGKIELFR